MLLAVVSDTHGYLDPRLPPLLQGVDGILHAGDVGTQEVLDELRGIAPVHAVRGNVDSADLGLPPTFTRRFGGLKLHMLHELPAPQSLLREWSRAGNPKSADLCRRFLSSFPEEAKIVVFGHTHEPCAYLLGGRLFFNPGSAGKKRFSLPRCFGFLEVSATQVQATFQTLDEYNEVSPESVILRL